MFFFNLLAVMDHFEEIHLTYIQLRIKKGFLLILPLKIQIRSVHYSFLSMDNYSSNLLLENMTSLRDSFSLFFETRRS